MTVTMEPGSGPRALPRPLPANGGGGIPQQKADPGSGAWPASHNRTQDQRVHPQPTPAQKSLVSW
jgi:hypothetical protein